jgi:Mg-chelatase subunit ChlD
LAEWLGEVETSRRDVVIVIDGSGSMGWRGGQ